jgi:hypothetical protein
MARKKKSSKKKRPLKVNRKKVQDAAKERSKGGGVPYLQSGVEMFRPEKGTSVIDILLYEVNQSHNPQADKGDFWYERTFFVHRGIGPNNDSVLCPAKSLGKPCPICEEMAKLDKDPDADEDTVKGLWPKKRQLFNVIDTKNRDKGPQVFDFSYHNFGKLLDTEINDEDDGDENATFPDLEGGKTLKIRWSEEKGGGYTYLEATGIKFLDRKKDYDEDILEEVHDLDSILVEMPYDDMKAMLEGSADEEEEPEEEEEDDLDYGQDDKKSKKKKKKAEPEEDEEEDDEDPEEEDDEEEEEDPEEEEDDEEEEEEKPAKKSKKKSSKKKKKAEPEEEEDDEEEESDEDEEEEEW